MAETETPICDYCEEPMMEVDEPAQKSLFRIPFTRWYVTLWNWDSKGYICTCRTDNSEREAYEAAAQTGYEKAINDYSKGKWN